MYEVVARAMARGVKWVFELPSSDKTALVAWFRVKLASDGIYTQSEIEQAIRDALDSKLEDIIHAVF